MDKKRGLYLIVVRERPSCNLMINYYLWLIFRVIN